MILNFIGNGSAFNTERKCNSAYFIDGTTLYLFDCGGDIFKEIKNKQLLINIKNICVFITHFHPDHCGSLGDLIFYNFYIHKAHLRIFSCDNIVNLLETMGIDINMYSLQILNALTPVTIDSKVNVSAVIQNHVNKIKSCGYIVSFNNKKFFYSGDSNSIPDIVLNNIDSFDEIYQDTCGLDYFDNPHLSFEKLQRFIPIQYRHKIYCMHIDEKLSEDDIINAGFNITQENVSSNMKIAIYPGSFDPVTKGHLHIISKATKLFDKVIVLIANNSKKKSIFTLDEKINMLKLSINEKNVKIMSTDNLTINVAKEVQANYIIRGLRNSVDFEYEQTINLVNKKLNNNVETVFLMADGEYELMSSSTARELLAYHSNVDWILPAPIIDICKNKYIK